MSRSLRPRLFSLAVVVVFMFQQVSSVAGAAGKQDGKACRLDVADVQAQAVLAKKIFDEGPKEDQDLRLRLQKIGIDALVDEKLADKIKGYYFKRLKMAKIDDQEQSGDCWIFAILSAIADSLYQQGLVPKGFEFSETYVYYFTNILKVDDYFNHVIDASKKISTPKQLEDAGPALKQFLTLIADGGDQAWLIQAIVLFGLVPKSMMKATFSAKDTEDLQNALQNYAGSVAKEMMDLSNQLKAQHVSEDEILERLAALKKEKSLGVHQILQGHLGYPKGTNEPIVIAERVKGVNMGKMLKFDNAVKFVTDFVKFEPDDLISVTQIPNVEAGRYYRIPNSGMDNGFSGGNRHDIKFLNVTPERFGDLIDEAILDRGIPVPFDSDAIHNISSKGVADPNIFRRAAAYALGRLTPTTLSLGDALLFGVTTIDHAMVIMGVSKPGPNGEKYNRLARTVARIYRNSWGSRFGSKRFKGDIVASADSTATQATTILIHKNMLTDAEKLLLESPRVVQASQAQVFGPVPGGGGDIGEGHP